MGHKLILELHAREEVAQEQKNKMREAKVSITLA